MMTRTWATIWAVAVILGWGGPAIGSILDFRQLTVDLTKRDDASKKVTWSMPDRLTITDEGLGWDGDAASSWDGWIETTPLAVGLSWRPAIGVSVRATITPAPAPISLSNGQTSIPYKGMAFVRYSPDLKHWSTWQAMEDAEGRPGVPPGRSWAATVQVPRCEREEYDAKLQAFMRKDVPWKSDEEAAVKWIVSKDRSFFARHIPFVGYVQLRYEGSFQGGQRLTSLSVEVSAGIGGVHLPPKDPSAAEGRDNLPWRFDGTQGVR